MTVNYTQDVATERLGGFFRLLFRWRGSIYQAIYGEIGIFLTFYFILSLIYRYALEDDQRTIFERICIYCDRFSDSIPVTFILGFYLVRVIGRRWTIWENMPWPDRFAMDVSIYINGYDLKSRIIRRTMVRYANLGSILCLRDICLPIRKRFPTLYHLISAGLMTAEEMDMFTRISNKQDNNWWIPFHWAYALVRSVEIEGKLPENPTLRLLDAVDAMRSKCWVLFSHDWIPVPMIYTQVCTLAVHLFMLASVLGRQWLDTSKNYPNHQMDFYFPFFTLFQLMFYLGWLKVAEIFINPLGLDADDFDMNYIVDRNLRVSYTIVDENYNKIPPLEKDKHMGLADPIMPHTEASKGLKNEPFVGSVINMKQTDVESRPSRDYPMNSTFRDTSGGRLINDTNHSIERSTSVPELFHRMISQSKPVKGKFKSKSLYRKNTKKAPPKLRSKEFLENIDETNENILFDLMRSDIDKDNEKDNSS